MKMHMYLFEINDLSGEAFKNRVGWLSGSKRQTFQRVVQGGLGGFRFTFFVCTLFCVLMNTRLFVLLDDCGRFVVFGIAACASFLSAGLPLLNPIHPQRCFGDRCRSWCGPKAQACVSQAKKRARNGFPGFFQGA